VPNVPYVVEVSDSSPSAAGLRYLSV